jgi:lambda family phage tail tape measure protein
MTPDDPFEAGFGDGVSLALAEMRGLAANFTGELSEASEAIRTLDGQTQKLSRSLSSSLRSAFDKAVFGGAKLSTVFRDLASSVAGRALDASLTPLSNSIAQGFNGALGGLSGALGSALGFANGGVFSSGRVRAFAKGGVINGPTTFPMRGGTGLMGEAGPEAIMPLTRGPDGKLGVAAQRGGGGSPIVVNIQTPDLAGFQRSRGQVSAQLARAVRRGQGGL